MGYLTDVLTAISISFESIRVRNCLLGATCNPDLYDGQISAKTA